MEKTDDNPKVIAAVGLGSNVGNRADHLNFAVSAFDERSDTIIMACSSFYETEAHVLDEADRQDDYLNAVLLIETSLSAARLMDVCLEIETARGRTRERQRRWAPRTLDVDLLVFGTETWDIPKLQIPHPRLAKRKFVLLPLFEIAPDLRIPPPIDATVQYLLSRCPDDTHVVRCGGGIGASENS